MSDDRPVGGPETPKPHDETQPIGAATPAESTHEAAPETAAQPAQSTTAETTVPPGAQPPRRRFVDRLWGIKSMIAVALAAVIIGGLGGAALANVGDDGDQRGGFGPGGRHGGFHHFGNRGGDRGGFGQNGQRGRQRGGLGVVPPTPSPSSTPTEPSTNS